MWDIIVIGSGISGLTAAAALTRAGQRVLLLEQHWVAGGLTQTFKRGDWQFATGVHYLSGLGDDEGPGGQFRRLLGWLSDKALDFAPLANPFDIVRIGDFRFEIAQWAERDGTVFVEARNSGRPGGGETLEWGTVYCVTLRGDRVLRGRAYGDRVPLLARLMPDVTLAQAAALGAPAPGLDVGR